MGKLNKALKNKQEQVDAQITKKVEQISDLLLNKYHIGISDTLGDDSKSTCEFMVGKLFSKQTLLNVDAENCALSLLETICEKLVGIDE